MLAYQPHNLLRTKDFGQFRKNHKYRKYLKNRKYRKNCHWLARLPYLKWTSGLDIRGLARSRERRRLEETQTDGREGRQEA